MYKPMESSSNLSPSSTISTSSSSSSSSSCSSTPANIPVSSQQRRQQQLQLHHYVQQQQRLFSRHQQNISSRAATGSSNVMKSSSPKLIPRNFFDCSTSDIIILVSSMLQELVVLNDALPFDAQNLTRFHSRSQPPITIVDYIVRITKFCSLEKSIILAMIYYIDLLCTTFKTFNINSLTVHRFLITSAMVASKGLCDTFCTNTHYAKVGGLSCMELNSLEVEFLIRVDYRIVPPADRLNQYFERMVKRMSNKYQFQDTIPKPSSLNSMTEGQNNDNTQTQSKNFASPASTNINIAATTTRIEPNSVSSPKQIYSINTDTTLPLRPTKKETHHQPPNHAKHEGIVLASDVSLREGRTSLSSKLKRPSAAQEEEHDIGHKTDETNNEPNNQKDQNPSVSYGSRHCRTPSKIRIEDPVNNKLTNGNQNSDDNTGINANIPNNTCDENKNQKPIKNSKALLAISSLNDLTPEELQQVQLQLQKRLANPGQNVGDQGSNNQQPVKFHNPFKTNNGNEAEMIYDDDNDDDDDDDDDDSGLYDDELA